MAKKSINHNLTPGLWVIALMVITLVLLLFFGCSPARHIERKNNAAVARVNADDQLQAKVVTKWMDAHPPIEGKPKVEYIQGKDILVPIVTLDYTYKNKVRDSLSKVYSDSIDCAEAALNAYDMGYELGEKDASKINRVRVDTIREKIPDLREANRWRDSAMYWKIYAATQAGQLSEKSVTVTDLNKKIKSKDWTIWILIAVGVLSHVLRSYAGGWFSSLFNMFKKK